MIDSNSLLSNTANQTQIERDREREYRLQFRNKVDCSMELEMRVIEGPESSDLNLRHRFNGASKSQAMALRYRRRWRFEIASMELRSESSMKLRSETSMELRSESI